MASTSLLYEITIREGNPFTYPLDLSDENGNGLDLSTYTLTGQGGIAVDYATANKVDFYFAPIDPAIGRVVFSLTEAQVNTLIGTVTFPDADTLIKQVDVYSMNVTIATGSLAITALSQSAKTFRVATDITAAIQAGGTMVVSGSTGNNGSYTIIGTNEVSGSTDIFVAEAIPSAVADGTLVATYVIRVSENDQVCYSREVV